MWNSRSITLGTAKGMRPKMEGEDSGKSDIGKSREEKIKQV